MLSTGICALDERLGGLEPDRHYLLTGAPGGGKTSLALSFLHAGLEAGEICMLITEDRIADLLVHASALGFDLTPHIGREQVLVFGYPAHFASEYARTQDARNIFLEIERTVKEHRPTRIIFDSLNPFIGASLSRPEILRALSDFLDRSHATVYLTVPGDLSEEKLRPLYDAIVAPAGGVFHLIAEGGGLHEIQIRKFRRDVIEPAPLQLRIIPGVGFTGLSEHAREELSEEESRRLLLVDPMNSLPEDIRLALQCDYSIEEYPSLDLALSAILTERYGLLLLGVEPHIPDATYASARRIRRMGNQSPILFFSRERGLRKSARARALRSGGDDFLTETISLSEIRDRLDRARRLGHESTYALRRPEPSLAQPLDAHGVALPLPPGRFREMVAAQTRRAVSPSFALVYLPSLSLPRNQVFTALAEQLRLGEGDRIGTIGEGIALYLHDVRRGDVEALLDRLRFTLVIAKEDSADIFCYPSEGPALLRWMGMTEREASERSALKKNRVEATPPSHISLLV